MIWRLLEAAAVLAAIGVVIVLRRQRDEPDLVARYRAAWDIPNEQIRRVER